MVPWWEPHLQDLLSCCPQRRHPNSNFPLVLGQQNIGEHHEHICASHVCFPKADCRKLKTPGSNSMGNQSGKHQEKKLTLKIISWKSKFPTSNHGPTQSIKQKPDLHLLSAQKHLHREGTSGSTHSKAEVTWACVRTSEWKNSSFSAIRPSPHCTYFYPDNKKFSES